MADVKISQLPAATTPLAGTEQIPLVQSSTTKQVTVSNLLTAANLGTPTAINLTNATNVPVDEATGILPVANGGNGTATPSLVGGTNITVSGSWPNQTITATGSAAGDVTGPSSATDNAVARFDNTTGKVIQNSGVIINDSGEVTVGVWKGTEVTVPYGGTGASTLTGIVKGNGQSAMTAAVAGTDYVAPGGALGTPSSGTATNLTGLPLTTGVTGVLPIANGGTNASTAATARSNILPSYAGNANKVLAVNSGATDVEYVSVGGTGTVTSVATGTGLTGGPITTTGTIALANTTVTAGAYTLANITVDAQGRITAAANGSAGTGTVTDVSVVSANGLAGTVATSTSTPAITLSTTVTGLVKGNGTALSAATAGTDYVAPGGALGTPSSGTATNLTGLPLTTGVTGTLPVANGGTGTTTPALVAGTNVTITGTWPNQTINASSTAQVYPGAGIPNSTGSAWGTSYSTTGTGDVVLSTSPTLVTPALGTPSSATLTNATGLPISTGVSGLGTGVATALAVAVGSAGAPVVNGGALGTPSSGTLTNATGLPIATGVSGLGTGVATFLTTPSSANLISAVSDETGSGVLVFNNAPALTNPTVTNYVETPYSANSSTAITLALTNGTVQIITLTGNATITMPTATSGKSFILYLKQDATGSRTVTWSTVKWPGGTAPTITSTASKQDIYSFFADGTNWYGTTVGQNYTP